MAYDIFVSYAHVDDQPAPGAEEGWVTTIVKGLKTLLAQKLGRSESFSLWIDTHLAGNVPITPEIENALRDSATLLLILSPGYVASDWCRREKGSFLATAAERIRSGSRVFLVECAKVPKEQYPPEFKDLRGYRFWVEDREGRPPRLLGMPKPDPNERRYYDLLNDLSHDLVAELQRLKTAAGGLDAKGHPDTRPAVFLAEATDDLDLQRDEVKRYLDQAGLRVLPDSWYARDESTAFQQAVDRDLAESQLFVQLLSGIIGKKPPGSPRSYARLQYERALAVGKPILQWRSRDLDVQAIPDNEHRTFLELPTVFAVGIEDFKKKVVQQAEDAVRKARVQSTAGQSASTRPFVFVDVEKADFPLGNAVRDMLVGRGVDCALPRRSGTPGKVRQFFDQCLVDSDALIIIYGSAPVEWVDDQLLAWLKKGRLRKKRPHHVLALCEGPPPEPEKEQPSIKLADMLVLNCRNGLTEGQMQAVLNALR